MTQASNSLAGENRDQIAPAQMLEWLDPQAAADVIAVEKNFIYDACQNRGLRHTRLGGKRNIRIRRTWLDEWMERGTR